MIVLDIEQRTDEWYQAKAGVPSASEFDKILTPTGKISAQQTKYAYRLVGEKIAGRIEEGYVSAAMQRGIDLEPEAKSLFELVTKKKIVDVGFVFKDKKHDVGCSPDGLIENDEGLEIKCPIAATQIEYLIADILPPEYIPQVQGSLYVTGRKRWHFFSYHPDLPHHHVVVERDEAWLRKFDVAIKQFIKFYGEMYKQLTRQEGGNVRSK